MTSERINRIIAGLVGSGLLVFTSVGAQNQDRDAPDDTYPETDWPAETEERQPVDEPEAVEERGETNSLEALLGEIRAHGDLNEIASILETVGLENLISADEPHTFYLPNDAAFGGENANALAGGDRDSGKLEEIVRGHISPGHFSADELRETAAPTLADHSVQGSRDLLLRRGIEPVDAAGEPVADQARLVEPDLEMAGMTVHIISEVWIVGEEEEEDEEEVVEPNDGLY